MREDTRRWTLALTLAALAACGSAATTAADAPALPDASATVALRFRVHVPTTTPAGDTIYIAGNFQGWDPAAADDALAPTEPFTYEIALAFAPGTALEFKFTRGSWATVEKGASGEEIANRTFQVAAADTVDLTVATWSDGRTSTRTGDITTITVPGFLDGRRVWVYLPPGYHQSTARYPVLYMLDGQNVFDAATSFAGEWHVDETLETLIPAGEVAPLVVVAVDNGGSARISEYTPWPDASNGGGGQADAHLAAITDVLVPYVNATYRTLTGPGHTGIAGSSLGGLFALYATYVRPDVFGRNGAFSPSIWWDGHEIVTFAATQAKPAALVYMDMGTAEYASAIDDLHAMRDQMVAQGFVIDTTLKIVEDPGAMHNEAAWARRFPIAARFLFAP